MRDADMYEIHRGGGSNGTPSHTASAPPPEEAHCERVATLAREIARRKGLTRQLQFVESVALLHHDLPTNVSEPAGLLTDSLRAVHLMLSDRDSSEASLYGEIVRLANAFDEMIEWLEFEPQSINHIIGELEMIAPLEGWRPNLMRVLKDVSKDRWDDLLVAGQQLPVSAVAAVRKLAYTPVDDLTVEELHRVALGDPVLTADIIRVVHSAEYHTLQGTVSSLKTGIVYLGLAKSRTVLLSSLARGVLASGGIRNLWQHSISVGTDAERLAKQCGYDPESAMLAGLLHDVGRLAAERLDSETLDARARMKERGAPAVWIDLITCRHSHAEVGSQLLANWGFSSEIVDGILHHHSPERSNSKLASILYLAEQQNPDNEAIPSLSRTRYAKETLHLPDWSYAEVQSQSYLSALIA